MSQTWAEILLFICCVAQMFCLTASVTSASRMMFAFSRDRAVPGHSVVAQGEPRTASRSPPSGRSAILAWALMIPTYWNAATGYLVGTSIAVIGLYIAFILPVILRFRAGRQLRARRLEPRQALQVDRPRLDRLGRPDLDPLPRAGRAGGDPVAGRLQLGRRELRTAHRRRGAAPLRRLVGHLGARTGSRARCGWAPRKSSSSWRRGRSRGSRSRRTRSTRRHSLRTKRLEGRRAPLQRRQPIQAPPFWSRPCSTGRRCGARIEERPTRCRVSGPLRDARARPGTCLLDLPPSRRSHGTTCDGARAARPSPPAVPGPGRAA